jgi:hypothetical protein
MFVSFIYLNYLVLSSSQFVRDVLEDTTYHPDLIFCVCLFVSLFVGYVHCYLYSYFHYLNYFLLSFSQFVRRLTIIVLEDTILHPDLTFLCWLMMACSTPHFVASAGLVDECLRIVCEICSCKIRYLVIFLHLFFLFSLEHVC